MKSQSMFFRFCHIMYTQKCVKLQNIDSEIPDLPKAKLSTLIRREKIGGRGIGRGSECGGEVAIDRK